MTTIPSHPVQEFLTLKKMAVSDLAIIANCSRCVVYSALKGTSLELPERLSTLISQHTSTHPDAIKGQYRLWRSAVAQELSEAKMGVADA